MHQNSIVLLSAASLLLSSVAIAADEGNDLVTAITSGKTGINVRARYEAVDKNNLLKDANALTARLRLNYRTGVDHDFSAETGSFDYGTELDHVHS